jgi:hypothetical protein
MRTNRSFLPTYCDPGALLPKVPETGALFRWRPYLVQDFIGKAISFLQTDEARSLGYEHRPSQILPCRWKCADESLFGVDLSLYAFTASYPFDKGKIGGLFNEASLGAAVHHGAVNFDLGGSHVGYVPGPRGGTFGKIWRPGRADYSTDCGYLMSVVGPFRRVYEDACRGILVHRPEREHPQVSVPNEYVHPSWSSDPIKLLVDLETLTDGEVDYRPGHPHTYTQLGRSLFRVHPRFVDHLTEAERARLLTPTPQPIGASLAAELFHIFDTQAELEGGQPRQKLLLYMKHILAARSAPEALKAAIVNTALEHNHLTDAIRARPYLEHDFICCSGVFIDLYLEEIHSYANLFQPIGMTIKPRGSTHEIDFSPEEIRQRLDPLPLAPPRRSLPEVLGSDRFDLAHELFTFEPRHPHDEGRS